MRKIIQNKRGQVFSIIALLIITLMFVSFEIYTYIQEKNVVKERVLSMSNFLHSVEANLERQMYISGFRILFLAENEITSRGEYIDVTEFFNEAFFNGTVYNQTNNTILSGATYQDIVDSLNENSKKINVEIGLTNSTISVTQENPWFVRFTLTSNFTMHDKENLARWEKQQVISADIPVQGFEDPVYIINSYSKVSRIIRKTPYEGNYSNSDFVTNLPDHVNKGYYAENQNAPSFLMRLEGNLSESENGIESFVILPDFVNQGLPTNQKSVIDYIYFSSENPTYYSVNLMPSWFKIDDSDGHIAKYQVTGLTY